MKRLLTLLLGIVLLASMAQTAHAQTFDFKTKQYVTTDFNDWQVFSQTTVAAGAATITIDNPWQPTVLGYGAINPFRASRKLLVDTGSVQETLTITSVSCSTATSCTVTGTFSNAHSGRYVIKSGTYGLQEALDYIGGNGGAVIVPPGSSTTTAMITASVGAASKRIVDMRSGNKVDYTYGATAYLATVGAANGTGVSATETGTIQKTVITLSSLAMTVTDALAYASQKIYDFPEGRIHVVGSTGSLAFTTTSALASTINSGAGLDWSLGTVAASASTLATTMLDLLPKVDNPTSTTINVAAAATTGALAAAAAFDGTATPVDAYLNVAFPTGTDIDGDGTLTISGTITITWINLGDF